MSSSQSALPGSLNWKHEIRFFHAYPHPLDEEAVEREGATFRCWIESSLGTAEWLREAGLNCDDDDEKGNARFRRFTADMTAQFLIEHEESRGCCPHTVSGPTPGTEARITIIPDWNWEMRDRLDIYLTIFIDKCWPDQGRGQIALNFTLYLLLCIRDTLNPFDVDQIRDLTYEDLWRRVRATLDDLRLSPAAENSFQVLCLCQVMFLTGNGYEVSSLLQRFDSNRRLQRYQSALRSMIGLGATVSVTGPPWPEMSTFKAFEELNSKNVIVPNGESQRMEDMLKKLESGAIEMMKSRFAPDIMGDQYTIIHEG